MTLLGGSLHFGRDLETRAVRLRLAVGPTLYYALQELTRRDADLIRNAGYATTDTRRSWTPGGMALLEVERELAKRFLVTASLRGGAQVLTIEGQTKLAPTVAGGLGVGIHF